MTHKIKPGKLYYNNNSKFMYDKIACVVEVSDIDSSGYIEYYWVERPNKGYYYALPSYCKQNWTEIDGDLQLNA